MPNSVKKLYIALPESEIQSAIGNKVRKAERLRELAQNTRKICAGRISQMYGDISSLPTIDASWVHYHDLDSRRLDAWFHRPYYLEMTHRFTHRDDLIPVKRLCQQIKENANLSQWPTQTFDYFEIAGIDSQTGEAMPTLTLVSEAPSRAKTLVQGGDVLVSTVRPNLKAVGQVSPGTESNGVVSSGFCVLRSETPAVGAYVRACLVHDMGTHQLMRWNSGGTYPAIEHSVPGEVLIPNPGEEIINQIGTLLLKSLYQLDEAFNLVESSKCDIENLINGTLDIEALSGEGEEIERWLQENPSPHTGENI